MPFLIDTNIAIYLRDVQPEVTARIAAVGVRPSISLVSWIELEGGITRDPAHAERRRRLTDILLDALTIHPLDAPVVAAYRDIVAALGYSRRQVFDRLIAATAIVHRLTLITMNADDFRAVPGLSLEVWPAPPQ
jgi:predicted nucleic acid-binding protein